MPLGFPLKKILKGFRPEALLNEITNYDTKLKEFNNYQTRFTIQNKCILKDYLNLLRD